MSEFSDYVPNMEKELRQHLLVCANLFAAAKGITIQTLARRAAGDWRFFDRISDEENSFTARKFDGVIEWFSDNWPDDLGWPEEVIRPLPSRGDAE